MGDHRSSPGSLANGFGAAPGAMSKPKGLLHGVVADAVIPRTRANNACGLPVIQGSITVGAATGSSARSRKPCRFFGAAPRTGFAASAAGASVSKPRQTATSRGARSIVLCGCRQPPPFGCPSNEGCQPAAGRQNKRVGTRSSHQLDRRREAVLRGPARQGEGGPAEGVERERVRDQPLP